MKTLGDYSNLCRRLDKALRDVAEGREIPTKTIGANFELFQLEEDGMVEIEGFNPLQHGSFDSVRITDKGRELLGRGGYSEFK